MHINKKAYVIFITIILVLLLGCNRDNERRGKNDFKSEISPLPTAPIISYVELGDMENYPQYSFDSNELEKGDVFNSNIDFQENDKVYFYVIGNEDAEISINDVSVLNNTNTGGKTIEYDVTDAVLPLLKKGDNTVKCQNAVAGGISLKVMIYSKCYVVKEKVSVNEVTKNIVDSYLYGLNMEITRSSIWNGLSAQMINNRKFYAGDSKNGPSGWQSTNIEYVTDKKERSICESNYIVLSKNSSITYTDKSLTVSKGKEYDIKIWTNSDLKAESKIDIKINDTIIKQYTLRNSKKDFNVVSFSYTSDKDIESGRFTISCTKGKIDIYQVSMIPKENYYGMRYDVIERLKEIGPTTLRFPGGCNADKFDWKESLLDVEYRTPMNADGMESFLFTDTYNQDCFEIGIDEFMELCKAVGAEPEITVSLVNSEAELAAELVKYCKDKGYRVKTWFVGNEIYYFGKELEKDSSAAAAKTKEFINKMKAADPDIKCVVGACTTSAEKVKWSKDYLTLLEGYYDYISFHHYIGNEFAEKDCETYIKNLFASGVDIGLVTLRSAIKQISRKAWNNSFFYIDEWNYGFGMDSSTIMMLSDAIYFHTVSNSQSEFNISKASFFQPINEGMIEVSPTDSKITIVGEMFRYLKKHSSGRVLKTDSTTKNLNILCTEHANKTVMTVINIDRAAIKLNIDGISYNDGKYYTIETADLGLNCDKAKIYTGDIEDSSVIIPGYSFVTLVFEK